MLVLLLGVATSAFAADPDPNKPNRVVMQVSSSASSTAAELAKVSAAKCHAEAPEVLSSL